MRAENQFFLNIHCAASWTLRPRRPHNSPPPPSYAPAYSNGMTSALVMPSVRIISRVTMIVRKDHEAAYCLTLLASNLRTRPTQQRMRPPNCYHTPVTFYD
jgi:hypothetical protein